MPTETWQPHAHVSTFFVWGEFAKSDTHPELVEPVPDEYRHRVRRLARDVMDVIRTALSRPIRTWSGYRSPALNVAIGGSQASQHLRAEAVDWSAMNQAGTALDHTMTEAAFLSLVDHTISVPCGQVIYYPHGGGTRGNGTPFVHIALPSARYPEPTFFLHDPAHGWTYREVGTADEVLTLLRHLPRPANPGAQ